MINYLAKIYSQQSVLLTSLVAGFILAPILSFLKSAYSNFSSFDYVFTANLVLLIVIDTITGIWVAYRRKELSSNKFGQLFNKVAVYSILLISIHAATTTQNTVVRPVLGWVDSVLYTSIAVRELLSIIENLAKLDVIKIPSYIAERLKMIDDRLNDSGKGEQQ